MLDSTSLIVPAHIGPHSRVVEETLDAANGADGDILVPEFLVGKLHDVLLADGIDDALDLAGGHAATGGNDLAANILGDGGGAVQGQEDGRLELGLGALNLGLGHVARQARPLAQRKVHQIVDTPELIGHEVDAPETRWSVSSEIHREKHMDDALGKEKQDNLPGVAVASGEAHVAGSQVVLVDDAAELAALVRSVPESLVVVADDGLGDQGGEVVGVAPADTLDGNGDVGGRDGVVADPDVGADEVGLLLGQEVGAGLGGLGGQLGEVLVGHLNKLLVGDAAGTDENHAVGRVVVLDVVGELSPGDVADVLAGAEDGAAQGLALVGSGVQVVKDNLLELLLHLLGLAQDDVALPLNGGLFELRVLEDVLQDVDALGDVLVQGLGKIDGVLALLRS